MDIGTLMASIGADISDLKVGVRKSNALLKSYESTTGKTLKNVDKGWTKSGQIIKNAVIGIAAAIGARKIGTFIKDTAMAAARYETLGIVMNNVGKNIGETEASLEGFSEGLRKTGISMATARTTTIRLMQAKIDLTNATKLGRIAQDAAVIGNINSSHALERLVFGIQTAQVEVLRTVGLNVSFEQSYKKLAKTLGKAAANLTVAEKTQARLNAVLEQGKLIAGTYEEAMTTAGKKMSSFVRHIDDFKVKMGQAFSPAIVILVDNATQAMKDLSTEVLKPEVQETLKNLGLAFSNIGTSAISATVGLAKFTAELSKNIRVNAAAAGLVAGGFLSKTKFLISSTEELALIVSQFDMQMNGLTKSIDSGTKGYDAYNKKVQDAATALRAQAKATKELSEAGKATNKIAQDSLTNIRVDEDLKNFFDSIDNPFVNNDKINMTDKEQRMQVDPEEVKRTKEILEERLEVQKEFDVLFEELGLNKFEIERQQIEKQAELYKKAGADKVKVDEWAAKKGVDIAKSEQDKKLSIYANNAGQIADTFLMIAQAGGKSSKEAFLAFKAFAIAEAIISANLAAAKVLGQTGIFGIPLSAFVWGSAMINVAQIAATQPPSYDSGGISNAKGIYQTGNIAEAHIPIPSGGKIPVKMDGGGGGKSIININMPNATFLDQATLNQSMTRIASVVATRVAPGAVVENYRNDGPVRQMVKGGV